MVQIRPRTGFVAALTASSVTFALLAVASSDAPRPAGTGVLASAAPARSLAFEPNAGRFPQAIDYLAHDGGVTLAVGPRGAALGVGRNTITTTLIGARSTRGKGERRLPGVVNWYAGKDSSRWRSGLETFGRVRYPRVYRGIDLVYHGRTRALEYDFVVAPGIDPAKIAMSVGGARSVRLAGNGDLVARVGSTTVRQLRPVAYQHTRGARRGVDARFVLDGNRLRFRLGAYDRSRPLVIDPVIQYSDYIGSTGNENALDVAADSDGNAYVAGFTTSPSLPGTSGTNPAAPAKMGWVTKVTPSGARPFVTYLGTDVLGIALGPGGSIYVAGNTTGGLAVTAGAAQGTYGGNGDAFAGRLNSDGTRNWVTYFGGSSFDTGKGIAVDGAGDAYISGYTQSPNVSNNMATSGAFDTNANGSNDAYAVKYSPSGSRLFSTYVGGASDDRAVGIGVTPGCQSACDVYIGGQTQSSDFPVSGGTFKPGQDAFMFKLAAGGNSRVWAVFYGTNYQETAYGMAVGPTGKATLVGEIDSSAGGQAMVISFDSSNGGGLTFPSAEFGGAQLDEARDAAYDAQGNLVVTGNTASNDLNIDESQTVGYRSGLKDAFAVKFTGLSVPTWSAYIGGGLDDYGYGVATDATGGTWIVGETSSQDFPAEGETQGASTAEDGFIARLQIAAPAITSGPAGRIRSSTASFEFALTETAATYKCRLAPAEADFSPCAGTGKTYSGLADGSYTFEVRAFDQGGTPGLIASRAFEVDTKPVAQLSIAPNPVLVGRTVTFDASGSSGADQTPLTKYEWDLDGDGSFERETATATTSHAYSTPQTVQIGLRVTDAAGATAVATGSLQVSALSTASQFGVTINNGAQFTRTPNVTVTSSFPSFTTTFLFSNDGGFLAPATFPALKTTKWKLDSSGPERLPKTIYVRFLAGGIVSETHQDDIILDEIPPRVQQATVAPAAAASSALATAAATRRRWNVRVRARDSNSGVSHVQVTAVKRRPGRAIKYKRKLRVRSAKRPRWLRARDRAGNWSRWKTLRRP